MDIASIIGVVIGIGSLMVAYSMDGGTLTALLNISAGFVVIGGSLGALAIAYGLDQLIKLPALVLKVIKSPKSRLNETLDYLIMLAENARRDGLLSLEKIINKEEPKKQTVDPLMKNGMLMVIDGADLEQIKDYLETEINIFERHARTEVSIFESLGGYAPTFGMVGTIMGMIQVLANMESPEHMATSIAVAFTATLYGVFLANLIFLPIANKLKLRMEASLIEKEMIVEGICSIRNGQNPKILRDKLSVYLTGKADGKKRSAAPAKGVKTRIGKEAVNEKANR
ncbi:MAG: motility protein A [Bacillota bacterium]